MLQIKEVSAAVLSSIQEYGGNALWGSAMSCRILKLILKQTGNLSNEAKTDVIFFLSLQYALFCPVRAHILTNLMMPEKDMSAQLSGAREGFNIPPCTILIYSQKIRITHIFLSFLGF